MLRLICVVLCAVVSVATASAQSLPPMGPIPASASSVLEPLGPAIMAAPAAGSDLDLQWFPLKFSTDSDTAEKFYNQKHLVAPLGQVKFLWGVFNDPKRRSLAADLASAVAGPMRVAFGTVLASQANDQTATQTESAQGLLDKVSNGGDVYVNVAYPVASLVRWKSRSEDETNLRAFMFVLPRIGLVSPKLGTNTVTEATEWNADLGAEFYGEYGNKDLKFFVQLREGLQIVSPAFATAVALPDRHFWTGQFSGGVQLKSLIRISVHRLISPPAPLKPVGGTRLLLQLAP